MFGTFRLMLALMVVQSHFAGGGLSGPVAVFGFFCLSGYLMTKIVNESYSDGTTGFLRYLSNRALRIYPAYYAAIIFAAGVLLLWPVEARTAAGWYMFPQDWLRTLSIIGLQPRSPILLVPAWSLHVEIIHFILIGAVLGRSRLLTSLWFFCSLAIAMVAILRGVSFDWLYFTPYGSSVAFATGAMIYQFREKLPAFSPKLAIAACCMLVLVGLRMPLEVARTGGAHASISSQLYRSSRSRTCRRRGGIPRSAIWPIRSSSCTSPVERPCPDCLVAPMHGSMCWRSRRPLSSRISSLLLSSDLYP